MLPLYPSIHIFIHMLFHSCFIGPKNTTTINFKIATKKEFITNSVFHSSVVPQVGKFYTNNFRASVTNSKSAWLHLPERRYITLHWTVRRFSGLYQEPFTSHLPDPPPHINFAECLSKTDNILLLFPEEAKFR